MENNQHTQELLPYLEALGLDSTPFTARIRDKRYYLDSSIEQQLNQLKHLVQGQPILLVVTGPPGSGKSTLKQMFLDSAAENLQCCEVTASTEMTEQELLNRIAACLDLPENLNSKITLPLLEDKSRNLARHDRYPVLVMDDAHLLPRETMELLLRIQRGDEQQASPWHVILFTDPALTAALLQLHIRQHYISMNPLTRPQIQSYLDHRLRIAGLKSDFPFDENDLDRIEEKSGGNPGEINQLAHDCLMEKSTHPARHAMKRKPGGTKSRKFPVLRWLFALLLTAVVTGGLLYQDEINQLFQAGSIDGSTKKEAIKLPDEPHYLLKKVPKTVVIERARTFTPPTQAARPEKEAVKSIDKAAKTPPVMAEKKPDPVKPVAVTSEKKSTDTGSSDQATKKPEPPVKTDDHALNTDENGLLGKAWLLSRNPAHYTIQLAAAINPQPLRDLVLASKLGNPKAMFTVIRNGKDWYVLMYGEFTSSQDVQNAIRLLPDPLKRNQPWPRKFDKIQAEIRQGHK